MHEELRRIEDKVDQLLALAWAGIEERLDRLLADRLDRDRVAAASARLGQSTEALAAAVQSATPAPAP